MQRLPLFVNLPDKINPIFRQELQRHLLAIHKQVNTTAFDVIQVSTSQSVGHDVVLVDASASAVTVTIPPNAKWADRVLRVKKLDSSANLVNVAAQSGETIDGTAVVSITTQFTAIQMVSANGAWYLV